MTDVPNTGSADAGNPAEATTLAPNGSDAGAAPDFLSALSEDNRRIAEAKGWTGPDKINDMLASYRGLEGKIGGALSLPGEDAKPEDRQAFFDKASAAWTPKGPEGYEFALPEGLPENFAYDKDFADDARKAFHEAKLSPQQAKGLHDWWVGKMGSAHADATRAAQDQKAATEKAMQEGHAALQKEWGEAGSDTYKQAVGKAVRVAEHLGIMDELTAVGVLSEPGEGGERAVLRPGFVSKLPAIFDALLGEDSLGTNGGRANPFASGSVNLTEQSRLVRDEPANAAALIKAAGKDPARYGLRNV